MPLVAKIYRLEMREEIWRPVVGYEGLYEVSNFGRVKSLNYKQFGFPNILRPYSLVMGKRCKRVYHVLYLTDSNGNRKRHYVHRLVALAFIPNPENKPCVDHIRGTEFGDTVWNLRWCTRAENAQFDLARDNNSKYNGMRDKFGARHHLSKQVCQFSANAELIKIYPSAHDAQREIGVSFKNISSVCLGKRRTAGGYIWKYA